MNPNAADDDNINADLPAPYEPPVDELSHLISQCSADVWATPDLRPMQQKIIRLMIDPAQPNAVLAVYRTGLGKSHVIRMLGVLDRGICMVFIPLLTLSADVMAKFQSACEDFGNVRTYHLDELVDSDPAVHDEVLHLCMGLKPSTDTTIFVFLSPQHLCKHQSACNVFLGCGSKGTLRTVVMDEVHLHVAHGLSFREECRQLKDIFFKPLFHPQDDDVFKPRLLCLTATMPMYLYPGLEFLMTVPFRRHNAIQRDSMENFLQTNIHMSCFVVGVSAFVKVGLNKVATHLDESDLTSKVAVFCNSKHAVTHLSTNLERKLDAKDNDSLCITIHGGLEKYEKFWRIRLFNGSDGEYYSESSFRVLVSTNAANVGIDNNHINLIVRMGLPRDLMTYFQERGRGARQVGSVAECILYASMSSYVSIISQILNYNKLTDTTDLTNEELEIRGAGSAITPLAASAKKQLEKRKDKAASKGKPKKRRSKYELSDSMKRQLRKRMLDDLTDVLRFFFLHFGCMHYRGAFYMSDGVLDNNIDACRESECTSCPVCTNEWQDVHLTVGERYKFGGLIIATANILGNSTPFQHFLQRAKQDVPEDFINGLQHIQASVPITRQKLCIRHCV